MTLDEYREAWQEQADEDRNAPAEEELLARVKRRAEAFDRKIFWRDVREIGAALLVTALFGWWSLRAGEPLVRIGALVVVAGAALVVWRLRAARRDGTDERAALPVAERIRAEMRKLNAQIELLESVLWWYVSPFVVGLALMILGGDGSIASSLLQVTLVLLAGAAVWWLNRRAVRRGLRPRRRELADLLRKVENGSGGRTGTRERGR